MQVNLAFVFLDYSRPPYGSRNFRRATKGGFVEAHKAADTTTSYFFFGEMRLNFSLRSTRALQSLSLAREEL